MPRKVYDFVYLWKLPYVYTVNYNADFDHVTKIAIFKS